MEQTEYVYTMEELGLLSFKLNEKRFEFLEEEGILKKGDLSLSGYCALIMITCAAKARILANMEVSLEDVYQLAKIYISDVNKN